MSARRGEGLSGGCKADLTLKEIDSFLLPPRPWSWCGGGVGSARCSLDTHPPCESSTCQRFKRRHVRRFGSCAEVDDTVVESWCVLSAPGVQAGLGGKDGGAAVDGRMVWLSLRP